MQMAVNGIITGIAYLIFCIVLATSLKGIFKELRYHNGLIRQQMYIVPSPNNLTYLQRLIVNYLEEHCPYPQHEDHILAIGAYSTEEMRKALNYLVENNLIVCEGKYYSLKKK